MPDRHPRGSGLFIIYKEVARASEECIERPYLIPPSFPIENVRNLTPRNPFPPWGATGSQGEEAILDIAPACPSGRIHVASASIQSPIAHHGAGRC